MTDGELVRQTLAGRPDAYAELVRRWAPRITALCHAKAGNKDAADDLAQESLLRGFRSLRTLDNPDKFGPWLCGIATRACLDWLKSAQRRTVAFSALGDEHRPDFLPDGRPGADAERDLRRLLTAVESLPEPLRQVVLHYYYEDRTYRELGELLGVSVATVNARLSKARALLRQRLESSSSSVPFAFRPSAPTARRS
jgi:RNA polymerase sigma-70 factor (ECF subfamily)